MHAGLQGFTSLWQCLRLWPEGCDGFAYDLAGGLQLEIHDDLADQQFYFGYFSAVDVQIFLRVLQLPGRKNGLGWDAWDNRGTLLLRGCRAPFLRQWSRLARRLDDPLVIATAGRSSEQGRRRISHEAQ